MNPRSLFVGIAVLFAALLAWWAFAERAPAPPQVTLAAPAVDTATATEATAPPVADNERATVATSALAKEPAPVRVPPWIAKLLVVDDEQQPVADATVTLWALWSPDNSGGWGRVEPALFELRTDARGRTQTVVTVETFMAEARKAGFRTSRPNLRSTQDAARDTTLVLGASLAVRGIVLDAEDRPVAGARVVALPTPGGRRATERASSLPATTGPDGRFTLLADRSEVYDLVALRAEPDERRTFVERVFVIPALPEVTLRFPGGITIRGSVVDTEGKPAAMATVMVRREPGRAARGFVGQDRADQPTIDGTFSIPVRTYARYQLIATKEGHASSKPVWVETTAERPHAETRLELLPLATIRGRVVQADGSPRAGMIVGVQAEDDPSRDSAGWASEERFPRADEVTTGDDGTFELPVHPDATWTVHARDAVNSWPQVRQTGVTPGRGEVVLRVTAADLAGCVVHGTVVRSDGGPAVGYRIHVFEYENGRVSGVLRLSPQIEGSTFKLPPLPVGHQHTISVVTDRSSPVASAQAGPFTTEGTDVRLEFLLQPWGALQVRVLDAAGAPARRVRVVAGSPVHWAESPQSGVGPDGCASLQGLCPGATTLRVHDDSGELCHQQVLVTPGVNPELVVHLPARK